MPLKFNVGQIAASMQAQIDAALAAAEAAQATGANARQMVLNRDPAIASLTSQQSTLATQQASLESLAATLGAAIPAADATHAAQWAAINALTAKAVSKQEKRVATTTLLALGATVDLAVTWTTPFPDANYLVIPLLDASSGVANVNPPALKSQTKDGCVISVRANVAVAAGLAVNVIGLRFG